MSHNIGYVKQKNETHNQRTNDLLERQLERFSFRLDSETARFLHEDSTALGMSSSAYLRMLVLQRRAQLRVTQQVQAQTALSTSTIVSDFADKALAILKDSVADKADTPPNENQ